MPSAHTRTLRLIISAPDNGHSLSSIWEGGGPGRFSAGSPGRLSRYGFVFEKTRSAGNDHSLVAPVDFVPGWKPALRRSVNHRLNPVSIWIERKGRIIIVAIIRTWPGLPVAASSVQQCGSVKSIDMFRLGRGECQVEPLTG